MARGRRRRNNSRSIFFLFFSKDEVVGLDWTTRECAPPRTHASFKSYTHICMQARTYTWLLERQNDYQYLMYFWIWCGAFCHVIYDTKINVLFFALLRSKYLSSLTFFLGLFAFITSFFWLISTCANIWFLEFREEKTLLHRYIATG